MKFIVFSDVHAHEYQSHATTTENGWNSRLVHCLGAVGKIFEYARDEKCPIIFGGDMFQVKGVVSVAAQNGLREWFVGMKPEILMIPGNHDMASSDGKIHALDIFNSFDGCSVFGSPSIKTINGCLFGFLPYPMTAGKIDYTKLAGGLEKLKRTAEAHKDPIRAKILVSHVYTHELMRKYHGREGDISAADIAEGWDLVLLGHHHIHDVVEVGATKVVSIGSPIQHTFNDRGDKRGFLVVDIREDGSEIKVEHIELDGPKFSAFEGEKAIVPERVKEGFVRVRVSSKAEGERARKTLEEAGAASIVVEVIPKAKKGRMDMKLAAKDEDIIEKFTKSEWGISEIDPKKLKEAGIKFLAA